MKRRFEAGGYRWNTGSEIMVNELGEHWVDFTVAFEGDHAGATAATQAWAERVQTFGGIGRITRVALRGTGGTHLHRFSEDIEEQVGAWTTRRKSGSMNSRIRTAGTTYRRESGAVD